MKKIIIILLSLVLSSIAVLGLISILYGEHTQLHANSIMTYFVIPDEIRNLPLPKECGDIQFERKQIECGGVCGTSYRIQFDTMASKTEIKSHLNAQPLIDKLNITQTQLIQTSDSPCHRTHIFLDIDERNTPK